MRHWISVLFVCGVLASGSLAAKSPALSTQQQLQSLLHDASVTQEEAQRVLPLNHRQALKQFYAARDFEPAWLGPNAATLSFGLLQAIEQSEQHGLDPWHPAYHKRLVTQLHPPFSSAQMLQRDLLLSDAFMSLAQHLYHGVAFHLGSDVLHHAVTDKPIDLANLLSEALQTEQIADRLMALAPSNAAYQNLQKALVRYLEIARKGGWAEDPEFYHSAERVKQRLIITRDYPLSDENQWLEGQIDQPEDIQSRQQLDWYWAEQAFSEQAQQETLDLAIRTFQARHNLTVDGIVGPKTRAKLAESVQEKIARIRLNLERWRWFQHPPKDHYVMVNIADFSLRHVDEDKNLSMKVVVGRQGRKTPMMEASMRYLVFNPYWRIPKTILKQDILPKLKKDIGYLDEQDIQIFSHSDPQELHPLDPAEIDWQSMTPNGILKYTFRQEAGPKNPLGTVKFMFPNRQDIYIHDTPSRYLFANNTLLASSGCIRAEKPRDLAYEILSRDQSGVTYDTVDELLQPGGQQVLWLKQAIPVYVTYQTVWADDSGRLFSRPDVYKYDAKLLDLFKK